MPVIYVDILVGTNLLVDYLLLRLSGKILHGSAKASRLLAASLLGGFSSLLLLVSLPRALAYLLKCAVMAAMTAVAFGFENIRLFLRKLAVFFGVNVAFAGLMLLLWCKVMPERIVYRNGAVYCEMSVTTLVIAASVCYGILTVVSLLSRRRTLRGAVYPFALTVAGQTREGKALFDTGNALRDAFSRRPVVVVTEQFARALQPCGFAEFCRGKAAEGGFRLIPFSTVGTEGVLPAFPAGEARFFADGQWHTRQNIYVAVVNHTLCGGECDALFGLPFYESTKQEVKQR